MLAASALLVLPTACSDDIPTSAPVPATVAKLSAFTETVPLVSGTTVPVDVALLDNNGAGVRQAGVVVTAKLTSGNGGLIGEQYATTNEGGVASFTGVGVSGSSGLKTVSFSVKGVPASAFRINLHSGVPKTFAITGGNNQVWYLQSALDTSLVVRVTDAEGFGVANTPVQFTVTAGGGRLSAPNSTTNANGYASPGTFTLGAVGTNTVIAKANGISQTLTFNATAQHLLQTLQIRLSSPSAKVGQTIQATLSGTDETGASYLPAQAPGWFIDQTGFASITQSGLVTGLAAGTGRIYVKIFNVTAQADIVIVP